MAEFKLLKYTDEIYYRHGTTDLNVLKEVLEKKAYTRPRLGFDVEAGEHWLDLGANIGAFSLYCVRRAAKFTAFEPDPSNFSILTMNVGHDVKNGSFLDRKAVTASDEEEVTFWKDKNHSRRSCYYNRNKKKGFKVPNLPGRILAEQTFDGVKMDIEGSEGPLLDNWYIPKCEKLVMEYHTSVDSSVDRLKLRLDLLKLNFKHVHYPPEYDTLLTYSEADPFFDRLIFCWGAIK